jgi:PAS domain S-box-containing protein
MSKDVTNEPVSMKALRRGKLFDSAIVGNAQEAVDFITNILESSTEYSVIGKDLDGKILLWNEGARLLYGYEPEEVVGKANSSILHVPEDVKAGRHAEIVQAALRAGKWEGTLQRVRKNGKRFWGPSSPAIRKADRSPATCRNWPSIWGTNRLPRSKNWPNCKRTSSTSRTL